MPGLVKSFALDDSGATAIEYGLIAGLIAVVIITALSQLGGTNGGMWDRVTSKVGDAMDNAGA